jgi:hypothetical protein
LQNISNNLPDVFNDYKGVTKSYNHMVNAPKRMEVPKKTIQAPSAMKRERATKPRRIMLLVSVQGKRIRGLLKGSE